MSPTVDQPAAEREPDNVTPTHNCVAGGVYPPPSEPVPVEPERRTVSLEVLTPALVAEEDQRRRVEAREQGVSFDPIPARAKVAVLARIGGQLGGVFDTDADWMATGTDLLVAMLRAASDFAADGEAELLMPTPAVVAALDGRPNAGFWTTPVPVTARYVEVGWLVVGYSGPGVEERVDAKNTDCGEADCPWPGDCTLLTIGEDKPQHFADWSTLTVRIPASVTR